MPALLLALVFGAIAIGFAAGGQPAVHGMRADATCTEVEILNAEQAFTAASQFGSQFEPSDDREELEKRLASFFASVFPQCDGKHPERVTGGGTVMEWDDFVATAVAFAGGMEASSPSRVAQLGQRFVRAARRRGPGGLRL